MVSVRERVRLEAGNLSVELAPAEGGSVATFCIATPAGPLHLFRPLPDGGHALNAAMFPMVPFANCIRDNRFSLDGETYQVPPNMAGSALNFHGSGWLLPWRLTEHGVSSAVLHLEGARVDDVYHFDAEQRFLLEPDGLTATLSVTNRAPRRMPFSFGLHPWFPRNAQTQLRFAASGFWTEGEGGVAGELTAVPAEGDYRTGRLVPAARQNNCYAGWDAIAEIAWPDVGLGLRVEADPVFSHLMFHVPDSGPPSFCIEPQSNAPCGFDGLDKGGPQLGVHLLASGETVAGSVRFLLKSSAGQFSTVQHH